MACCKTFAASSSLLLLLLLLLLFVLEEEDDEETEEEAEDDEEGLESGLTVRICSASLNINTCRLPKNFKAGCLEVLIFSAERDKSVLVRSMKS
jgi:hypothetical protein